MDTVIKMNVKPIKVEKVITIPLGEGKSLSIISSKYLGLKNFFGNVYIYKGEENLGGENNEKI